MVLRQQKLLVKTQIRRREFPFFLFRPLGSSMRSSQTLALGICEMAVGKINFLKGCEGTRPKKKRVFISFGKKPMSRWIGPVTELCGMSCSPPTIRHLFFLVLNLQLSGQRKPSSFCRPRASKPLYPTTSGLRNSIVITNRKNYSVKLTILRVWYVYSFSEKKKIRENKQQKM